MRAGDIIAQKYRLERQLAAGGMGMVWVATHTLTHKSLALKFVLEKHDDPGAKKRALREARAACAVTHPNVVAVHDVLEGDDGMPVLVMDLLRGESLAGKLERERTLSPSETLRIVRPVLEALSVAHGVGVVHRDLKPDNVFLCEDGGVKILDFGVAKLRGSEPGTKETNRLTETGAMIGTPHYMAPEQAFGEGDTDLRADLFSVGAVMYECIAGVPPTDGQNLGQILKALATARIKPIAERAPEIAPELAAVIDRLLAIERDERPASARAALTLLDAMPASTEAKLAVREPSARESPRRPSTPAPATRDAEVTPAPTKKSRAFAWGALVALVVMGGAGGSIAIAKSRGASAAAQPDPIAPIASTSNPPVFPAPIDDAAKAPPAASIAPRAMAPSGSIARTPAAPTSSAKPRGSASTAASGNGADNHLLSNAPF